jgi:hypothetical protein
VAALAGPVAESQFTNNSFDDVFAEYGVADLASAKAALAKSPRYCSLTLAMDWTFTLVEARWDDIVALAVALERTRRLTYREVRALLG